MLSQPLQDALNAQIKREIYSEYTYFSMAAWLTSRDLDGFANFFHIQAQEEHDHVMRFFNFVHDRGGRVLVPGIDNPETEFSTPLDIFEKALEHERYISKHIHELVDLAYKENDHPTRVFLQWFVDEQVEEEATMDRLRARVAMVDGNGHGLLMLDNELAGRTYTGPEA
jgi:ferritin